MSSPPPSAVASTDILHSRWSPEIRVMARPAAVFQQLTEQTKPTARGNFRRPLFFAFLLGCMVSLVASQVFTLRHMVSGAVCGSFILLTQVFALAIVRPRDPSTSFSETVNLFFTGYGPWALWIIAFSAVRSLAPSPGWGGIDAILLTAGLIAIWSGYIDFCFFLRVSRRTPARATGDLVLQRAISWGLALPIFGAGPLLPEIVRIWGR